MTTETTYIGIDGNEHQLPKQECRACGEQYYAIMETKYGHKPETDLNGNECLSSLNAANRKSMRRQNRAWLKAVAQEAEREEREERENDDWS